MKLTVEVEAQFYGETEDEQKEYYAHLAEVISMVVGLSDFSVGTFVRSHISREDEIEASA